MTQRIKNFFYKILTVGDFTLNDTFSLGQRVPYKPGSSKEPAKDDEKQGKSYRVAKKALSPAEIKYKRAMEKKIPPQKGTTKKSGDIIPAKQKKARDIPVARDLQENLATVKEIFHYPDNKDIVFREFNIALDPPRRAGIVYVEGIVDRNAIDGYILQPLMLLTNLEKREKEEQDFFQTVEKNLIPGNQVDRKDNFGDIVSSLVSGVTAVFIDGANSALLVETKSWPTRGVNPPQVESAVQGPQEGFNELLRTNTGLIRKRLRTDALVTELYKIGEQGQTDLALMYLDGVINPKLVKEARRRIKSIKISYLSDVGTLAQLIEDNARLLIPGTLITERPDRVAAYLVEGHLALLVDGSPFALIAPITLWSMLHTAEDHIVFPVFANFLRLIRVVAFFIALLLPATYVAVTNYHPEMIPTDLLLAIAASREKVPFPVVVEVVIMELSLELIREAGIRVPGIIGNTVGIVGALILGQAAVQANIVSPLLVIVVAITGLANFAIPNIRMAFLTRLLRFGFIILASIVGFYGIAFGLFLFIVEAVRTKSFGVPVMSPVAPFRKPSGDTILLKPYYYYNTLPAYTRPLIRKRQVRIIRRWDPNNRLKGEMA